jgi:diguanylate cyclase (GGDEF)-like protein/PAS domain S-box-containing protein
MKSAKRKKLRVLPGENKPNQIRGGASLVSSEIRFRRLYESAQDGILILDGKEGKILEANPYIIQLLEYPETELLGKELWQIGLFEDQKKSQVAFNVLQQQGYVRYEDLPLKTKNGLIREVEFVSNAYQSDGERVIQCNIRDITERRAKENVLAASHEDLKQTVRELAERNFEFSELSEMADSLQTCVSLEEAYRVVARCCTQLFPGTQGVLYTANGSQNVVEIAIEWGAPVLVENEFFLNECVALRRGRVHAVDGAGSGMNLTCQHIDSVIAHYLCAPMIAYGEIQGVLHLRNNEKQTVPVEKSLQSFAKSKLGLAGTIADYIGLALANLKLRETLRQQSIHDPITGLYNRRYMREALERELRRSVRDQRPLGILMFDIDHFKKLNDTYGHEAGDAVLKAVGSVLRTQIRGNDIPCRYGGEEFLIILPGIPLDECEQRAEKLREELKRLDVQHDGKSLPRISFSVGVSAFPNHGDILDDLLKVADTALYSAKTAGRDRVVVGQATAAAAVVEGRSPSFN